MSVLAIIDAIINLVLGFCITVFYIYLYGDDEKIVHKWSFIGHWSLRLGLIGIVVGVLLKVWAIKELTLAELVFDTGLTAVFMWAYLFHRKLFKSKLK